MRSERVAAGLQTLVARYDLDDLQGRQLATLLSRLETDAWAPTSVRAPDTAINVHVADSLVALELDAFAGTPAIADIGAGAGLPGLVLAVALPAAEVSLVESHGRKCGFISSVAADLDLTNAHAVCARAEEWHAGERRNDVVVARALAPQPVVLEYAAPLLRLGGVLVDWRGRRIAQEEDAAARAAEQLGLRRVEIREVHPFAAARDHHLHVFAKVDETPPRYPRRPGIARKRPLGG